MAEDQLADMHRIIGEAEHSIERKMLREADQYEHPDEIREQAHELSRRAAKHLDKADDLDHRAGN